MLRLCDEIFLPIERASRRVLGLLLVLLGHILADMAERCVTSYRSLLLLVEDEGDSIVIFVVVRVILVDLGLDLLMGTLQREVLQTAA